MRQQSFISSGLGSVSDSSATVESQSGLTIPESNLWPEGVVKYRWDTEVDHSSGDFKKAKQLFEEAMRDWETGTCVKFQESKLSEKSFDSPPPPLVTIGYGKGSSHTDGAGIEATRAQVQVNTVAGESKGIRGAHHEIGHVLGLGHTHARPDSHRYLTFDHSLGGGCERVHCWDPSMIGIHSRMVYHYMHDHPTCKDFIEFVFTNSRGVTDFSEKKWGSVWLRNIQKRILANPPRPDEQSGPKEQEYLRFQCGIKMCLDEVITQTSQKEDKYPRTVTPYDINSVMHYTLNSCMQARTVAPDTRPIVVQHRAIDAIQSSDFEAIWQMYECGVRVTVNFRPTGGSATATEMSAIRYIFKPTLTLGQIRRIFQRYIRWRHDSVTMVTIGRLQAWR